MLGELVELQFEKQPGEALQLGEAIGFVEGFKAVSDLFSIGCGTFERANPKVLAELELLANDPYGEGWLYEFSGQADTMRMDAPGYRELLGITVSRMQAAPCPDEPAT